MGLISFFCVCVWGGYTNLLIFLVAGLSIECRLGQPALVKIFQIIR